MPVPVHMAVQAMFCAWAAASRGHAGEPPATEGAGPSQGSCDGARDVGHGHGHGHDAAATAAVSTPVTLPLPLLPLLPVELWWLVFAQLREVDWSPL